MSSGIIALRAAGVAVVLDASGPGLPRVLHWGADPGRGRSPRRWRRRWRGPRSTCRCRSRSCPSAPPGTAGGRG